MTAPRTDWSSRYDEIAREELAAFNAYRDAFLGRSLQAGAMMAPPGMTPQSYASPVTTQPMQAASGSPPLAQWKDEDLVGAAVYWGIPEQQARQMPRHALLAIVENYRSSARAEEQGFGKELLLGLGSFPAMVAIGAGEAITGGLQRLPIIGEALGRIKIVHAADNKLRQLEEAVRTATPESFQWVNTVANLSGNVAAMWYPGTAAWAVAGKMGFGLPWLATLGPSGGAIARLASAGSKASQGIGAGILLAGGKIPETYLKVMQGKLNEVSPEDAMEAVSIVGGSAALPAAWAAVEPAAQALATRVQRFFMTPETMAQILKPHDFRPGVMGPRTARGPTGVEPTTTPSERLLQLRGMAAAGDEQAQMMLDYMNGGRMEIPVAPLDDAITTARPIFPSADPGEYAIRRGDISPEGAYFSTPGASTYFDPDAVAEGAAQAYRLRGRIADTQDPFVARQILQETLQDPRLSAQERQRVIDLLGDDPPYISYMENDELPLPDAARRLGFHGIKVWENDDISNPTSVFMMNVSKAESVAVQMNKAATIVQSPAFPEIASQTVVDDVAVATAAYSTNPAGTNVVPAITDPKKFVEALSPHTNVRFTQRGTRLDAIFSDEPITDQMVKEYETFGMHTGQKVYTPEGLPATISKLEGLDAWVHIDHHTIPWKMAQSDLHPWITSPKAREVPELWDQFNEYANGRLIATSNAMGGALSQEQLATIRTQNLQQYMQDFFEEIGATNPSDQAAIRKYFNIRFVTDYRSLAPEESAFADAIAAAAAEMSPSAPPAPPVSRLDGQAATKGMSAIPGPNGQWILLDNVRATNPVSISFPSVDAAEAWVKTVNRELADITPETNVPLEVGPRFMREPTQGPNLNAQTPTKLLESIAEMEAPHVTASGEVIPGGGGVNIPPAEVAAAQGNYGRLKNLWTDGFLRWQPARRLFSRIDQAIFSEVGDSRFSQVYDKMSNVLVKHHNDQHPWMDRATDVLKPVKISRFISGEFTRIYEIEDDAARLAAAQAAGFENKEIQALEDVHQFFRDMFAETGLDPNREIKRYVSHIAQRQSNPQMMGRAFEDFPLTPSTRPFYEYARTGNMNAREMDMRELMDTYIRAVTWEKNMAEPFGQALGYVRELQEAGLESAANVMENWLKIIRYGYHSNDDTALDTMHGALRLLLGPEVTRQQAAELFNFGLNATHSGLLGYRLNVLARDSQQLLLAVPRAGVDLLRVMKDYMTSADARRRIWDEALAAGAIQLQRPRMAVPGAFAGELERIGGAEATGMPRMAQSEYGWRMRAVSKISAAIGDMMPGVLRDVHDTPLHPMYLYGKQSELMRALVWTAGRDKAQRAIAAFREAGPAGDLAALMGESGARTFDPAWRRQFEQLIAANQDEEAASFLGRQLADATQFKYGNVESPWIAKNITGRMVLQFGNYSLQYYQYLRETLANGEVSDKVKFLALAAGVTTALEAASKETGWNFRYMNPFFGLGFTTGPWLGLLAQGAAGASAMIQQAYGNEPTQGTASRVAGFFNAGQQGLNILNPLGGLYENVQAAGEVMNSPYPGAAAARYLITGERSQWQDVDWQQRIQSQHLLEQSLRPMNNPATQQTPGTTQIPPRTASYPPGMTISPDTYPGVQDPSRVYNKGGQLVYDTPNMIGGHVPTHALSGAPNVLLPGETWEQAEQRVTSTQYPAEPPRVRDLDQLDPDTNGRIQALMAEARQAGIRLEVGETARSQARQNYLFAQGRSPQFPGQPVTWTLTSNHTGGNAIDFIVNGDASGKSPGYQWLWEAAKKYGLVAMGQMDPGHLQVTDSSRAAVPFNQMPAQQAGTPQPPGGAFY